LTSKPVPAILDWPETKFGVMPCERWSADWHPYISGSIFKAAKVSGLFCV
jgi:hypothetical protein